MTIDLTPPLAIVGIAAAYLLSVSALLWLHHRACVLRRYIDWRVRAAARLAGREWRIDEDAPVDARGRWRQARGGEPIWHHDSVRQPSKLKSAKRSPCSNQNSVAFSGRSMTQGMAGDR